MLTAVSIYYTDSHCFALSNWDVRGRWYTAQTLPDLQSSRS